MRSLEWSEYRSTNDKLLPPIISTAVSAADLVQNSVVNCVITAAERQWMLKVAQGIGLG